MRSLTIALCLLVAPLRRGFLLTPHDSTFPPCPSRPCQAPPLTECASKTADTLLMAASCAAQVLGPDHGATKVLAKAAVTMAKADRWKARLAVKTLRIEPRRPASAGFFLT